MQSSKKQLPLVEYMIRIGSVHQATVKTRTPMAALILWLRSKGIAQTWEEAIKKEIVSEWRLRKGNIIELF